HAPVVSAAERVDIPSSTALSSTAKKRYVKAITLWLVAAVLGGIAAVLAWHPGAVGTENKAFVNSSETSKVMAQLSSLACIPFNYTWQTVTEDMERASSTLTGTARDEFDKVVEVNRSIIVQRQAESFCQLDHLGLSSLTRNEAQAIGALIVQVNAGGKLAENNLLRLQYTMVRVGDDWKISEVTPVE
ncbi:MAG: hypothetical protein WAW85_13910, partial [Gordonia sp. (in: high G+C Gram-positive bacteria)]